MSPALPRWPLSAFYFAYFAYVGAVAPYFSLYLASLGFAAAEIGILLSLGSLTRIIGPNLWGWAADRSGQRARLLSVALALACAGYLGFFFVRSFWGLFALLLATGFFVSAAMPLAESITLAHLRGSVQSYGAIRLWGSVGFILTVTGIGYALDALPVSSLLWMVLGGAVLSWACALFIPDAARDARRDAPDPVLRVLRRPEVAALLGACFLMSVAHGPLYAFYSIYLVAQGYAKASVGWMWTLGVVAEIVVFMLMPRAMQRWSLAAILKFCFAATTLRFLIIGWGVEQILLLWFAQLLHGLSFGAYHAASVAAFNRWFQGANQVRGQALYLSVSFGAGGMAGSALSGLAWDRFGAAWTFSAAAAAALAGYGLLRWKGHDARI